MLLLLLLLLVAGVASSHVGHPALHLLQTLQDGHPELVICRDQQSSAEPRIRGVLTEIIRSQMENCSLEYLLQEILFSTHTHTLLNGNYVH